MIYAHLRNLRGFLSDYYLGSVFGSSGKRGSSRRRTDREIDTLWGRFSRLHTRCEDRELDATACRERFARPLLRDVLGTHTGDGSEHVFPLFRTAEDAEAGAPPILLAWIGAWSDGLDGSSGPQAKLAARLAHDEVGYGLLVTGESIRLIRRAGDGARGAALEVDLAGLAAKEDRASFEAFIRLFSGDVFQPDADGHAPIELIEAESRQHAEKVSRDLREAVFRAAESLITGLVADHRGRAQAGGAGEEIPLGLLRDAALTALYRILFILYAEARDPRLQEHDLYRKNYSIEFALMEVLERDLSEWPGNRSFLWQRLLSLFRIFDEGLPPILEWENLPPRGGDFFDADTPAGRVLDAARLPDSTVARVLLDIATSVPRRGVGRERVSFRELDIEDLGSVYEGLLAWEPRLAAAVSFEVQVQGQVFVLTAEELVALCQARRLVLQGDRALVAGTIAERLHPEAMEEDDEREGEGEEEAEVGEDEADEGDEDTGVGRGAAARLKRRFEAGDFVFVPGSGRKGSGAFYTPLPLVQDLVRHTLEPLVAGRDAAGIERLRVLDPACGSAHFLVEAMRYLGQALHRAYVREHDGAAPPHFRGTRGLGWDAECEISDPAARLANSEARAWCKRRIAERCLFGVDRNATAVQLAHVALWIESLAGDRPLSFFEHHVRCGNSLLGSWLDRLFHPPLATLGGAPGATQEDFYLLTLRQLVEDAAGKRRLIDETSPESLLREGVDPESVGELDHKDRLRRQVESVLASARLLFDLRAAAVFLPEIWPEFDRCWVAFGSGKLEEFAESREWWNSFEAVRRREAFFHWELEFPEVFLAGGAGFDAILGNPPWDKVLPSQKEFYAQRDMLIRGLAGEQAEERIREMCRLQPGLREQFDRYQARTKATAAYLRGGGDFPLSKARSGSAHEDVSKYFVDRAARLVAMGGRAGLVVPGVVYNGDGCVALRRWLLHEASIERFFGFENRLRLFPIHASYKFVNLVFRRGSSTSEFRAAFMRHDPNDLMLPEPQPFHVTVSREEIERLSPDTYALLEYRGARDQEIVRKMHEGRPTLGGNGVGAWGAELVSWRDHAIILNTTEDKDLFTDPGTARLYTPESVIGSAPADARSVLEAMRARGYWPVFEGKHIDQWVTGRLPLRWWLSTERMKAKYGREPRLGATLVFRETASNTNERTVIAAVLPPCSAGSHTLTGLIAQHVQPGLAASVLNSFIFDFALRLRASGTHVSFTYILPVAVPAARVVAGMPELPTTMSWRKGAHVTDELENWPSLWEINRAVAEGYGLGPDDLDYILSSFPVLARKRPKFLLWVRQCIQAWRAGPASTAYPPVPHADVPLAADNPRQEESPVTRRGR